MDALIEDFWTLPADEALRRLDATTAGLSKAEAARRLAKVGPNTLGTGKRTGDLSLLLKQFATPIVLILLAAATLSGFLKDLPDALIIMVIVLVSGLLGFYQERGAAHAVEKLLAVVAAKATVLRDGAQIEILLDDIAPGDIVLLDAGDGIPADCLVLDAKELFVDQSTLTGETYPTEKEPGVVGSDTPLAKRSDALFMGTHVVSGTGRALVMRTGMTTEFGKVSERLGTRPSETEFEHGVKQFGFFLMEVTLLLVIAIFFINVLLHKPVLDSFLFSLALAVGLTPQLLPAIISVNLAHGARRMALQHVIVKKLAAIENFGSMNVLCSDKTGTLTQGIVHVKCGLDPNGDDSDDVLKYAYLNSAFETGFTNPIDEAVRSFRTFDIAGYSKLDEEPYDFVRKRLSILVAKDGKHLIVTKGSTGSILGICTRARMPDGTLVDVEQVRPTVQRLYEEQSAQGFRTLGVAYRDDVATTRIDAGDEQKMILVGLLVLFDPPKADALDAVRELRRLGVSLKIITGDNALVASTLGVHMGLEKPSVLTGGELHKVTDSALATRASQTDIFAEIEPNQKERIIASLRTSGNVVGFMGDGINDASALHAADVSISVNTAVDVAKEAADIVLLREGLDVLSEGVKEGRRTFANTLKYVFMATSANFGNMFSMAGASLFLPFLPLLPTQILLMNLITDFPELTIATDSVDAELVDKPRRWNVGFIRDFMLTFGSLSSIYDYLTFGALLLVLHAGRGLLHVGWFTPADQRLFQSGWFVESVLSASVIVLVIRTRRSFLTSRPSTYLILATIGAWVVTLALPYTPVGAAFHFAPLPLSLLVMIGVILVVYISTAELTKRVFFAREGGRA